MARHCCKIKRGWSFEHLEVRSLMSGDGLDASVSALFATAQNSNAFPRFTSEELREALLAAALKRFENYFGQPAGTYLTYGWAYDQVFTQSVDGSRSNSETNVQVAGID